MNCYNKFHHFLKIFKQTGLMANYIWKNRLDLKPLKYFNLAVFKLLMYKEAPLSIRYSSIYFKNKFNIIFNQTL